MEFCTETAGWTEEASTRLKARIGGGLYLINIVAGAFHYGFVRSAMVVSSDAGATAANILKHELVYRLGFAAAVILLLSNVPLALIFYDLFKVVNRSFSALVAFFILVGTAIEAANLLNYFVPIILLHSARYSSALSVEQLQALAYMALALQAIGFNVAVAFFAFYDLLIGYLIFRSTFVPRTVGLLMATGGLCYLINSFANFLAPRFAVYLLPYILVPSGLAELSFCLWLLVLGVNVPRWEEKATAAERRGAVPLKAAL
jgi:hypothetical protein